MKRLSRVRRLKTPIVVVVIAVLWVVPIAGSAQSNPVEMPVEMTVAAGIDGLVAHQEPVAVTVDLTAQVLFVGSIGVEAGGSQFVVPVEVPAGSTKVYTVTLPPIAAYGGRANVRLMADGASAPSASERLRLRTPDNQTVVVGVIGEVPELNRTLTAIGDVPLEVVSVDVVSSAIDVVDYLVVMTEPDDPGVVSDWVTNGGSLIGTQAVVGGLGLATEDLGVFPGTDAAWFSSGNGEVVVDDSVDAEEWPRLIRPVPRVYVAQTGIDPDSSLMEAASVGDESRIPSLPWLLAAIAAYVLVAGPVMFFVLGRMRRRELAWFIGPAVSLVALGSFWLLGRQQLDDIVVNHASVIVLGDRPVIESGVVVATGAAGRHSLTIPDAITTYGSSVSSFGVGSPTEVVIEGSTATFDLAQLGFAGVRSRSPVPSDLAVSVVSEGDELTVTNQTGMQLGTWGVMWDGGGSAGTGSLAPGDTGSVTRVGGQFQGFINPADMVSGNFNDQDYQVRYPLGNYVSTLGIDRYFFAYVDGAMLDVELDGRPRRIGGPSLIVVPLDSAQGDTGGGGAEVISVPPGAFVEAFGGPQIVNGPSMTVRMVVPTGATEPTLVFGQMFGMQPGTIEFWDWSKAAFVDGAFGPIPSEARNARGEVVVRAGSVDEFGGSMSPSDMRVEWQ